MAEENQNNPSQLNPPLEAFLDSCLWDKGIRDVPEDLHKQMIEDLANRLQTWLMQAVFAELKESDAPEVEALMDKGASQEEIMQLLYSKVPNLEEIFSKEMAAFKKAYLGI